MTESTFPKIDGPPKPADEGVEAAKKFHPFAVGDRIMGFDNSRGVWKIVEFLMHKEGESADPTPCVHVLKMKPDGIKPEAPLRLVKMGHRAFKQLRPSTVNTR